MSVDLAELANPQHTAVLTMEMQRGVIGDLSNIPQLAEVVSASGTITHTADLLMAARKAGVRVVHCTAEFRRDRAGSAANSPLLAALARNKDNMIAGTEAVEVVPELGMDASDIVQSRVHGLSPFAGTSLDMTLRNLGVTTVVATGVSVNIGVLGLAIEAVNLGYRVVIPTDCVAGVPEEYAEAVMANTLALLATRTTAAKLIASWSG
jgi:nicotinamidase-related amidase